MTQDQSYVPSIKILNNYARVLIKFALNSGAGVKPGEVVAINVPDIAKPLAKALQKITLEAGAHPMIRLLPTGFEADFYNLASPAQLEFFPTAYQRARTNLIDHTVSIIADPDPYELANIPPDKIFRALKSRKRLRDWLNDKENRGKFTWTAALWGVEAKANLVGLSLKDYWQQIINACFLDQEDPIKAWKEVATLQRKILTKLNNLEIDHLKVVGQDVNLVVKIGPERSWQGGSGRNIPSFEFFTSPDWRGVEGEITFNQPLYRYGNLIEDVSLVIKAGKVIKARAKKGQKFLDQMIKTKNADKIGEFSLTDRRLSRITHVMAETLYDENIGGPFGNTHLALGMAYQDCYKGDPSKLKKSDWKRLGYNDSAEHTDIVSTTDREVTAILSDGSELKLYHQGQFLI